MSSNIQLKDVLNTLEASIVTLKEAMDGIRESFSNRPDITYHQRLRLIEYDRIILKQQKLVRNVRKKAEKNPSSPLDEETYRILQIVGQLALMLQEDSRDLYMEIVYKTTQKDRFHDA